MEAAAYGLAAILAVMLAKEIGVPVPIPSDLLMIAAGVQASVGVYPLPPLLLGMLAAVAVGASVQFLLVRRVGRSLVYRIGPRVGLRPERLDAIAEKLRAGGALGIFLGLNIPGARAGIVPAAALAGFSYAAFAPPGIAGAALFHGWHVALGFVAGPAAVALLESASVPLLAAFAFLAAAGLVGALAVRARSAKSTAARRWTEAACPACLASTLIPRRPLW